MFREAVGKVAAQIFSASGVKGMPPNLPSTTYHTHTEFDYLPLEYAANLIMQERSAHMHHGGYSTSADAARPASVAADAHPGADAAAAGGGEPGERGAAGPGRAGIAGGAG